MTNKICCSCKIEKPLEEFSKNKAQKDGYHNACKPCKRVSDKLYRENNKEKVAAGKRKCYLEKRDHYNAKTKEWVKNNPEVRKRIINNYYIRNQETILEKQATYRSENREACNSRVKGWAERNPDKLRAKDARRRSRELKAQPFWLTDKQKQEIGDIYNLARDCELVSGEKYHVDHIVPLQGKTVCGLHVSWNLQVLPASVNIGKSNKFNGW
jgi:hypothetical protein